MRVLQKYRLLVTDFLKKGLAPRQIAAGIALGNFVGILPFLGLHTVMAVGLAYLLRLNIVIVFLGANISNPITFPFILFASAQLGSLVLRGSFLELSYTADLGIIKQYVVPTILGSVILGAVVSAVSYVVTLRLARRFRQ